MFTRIMEKVLHKKNSVCCLCFKAFENDRMELDDNVVLLEEDNLTVKVSEVACYVFGVSDLANITPFEAICVQCATSIVNCYKFIKNCRDNLEFLSNAVDNFMVSLVHSSQNEALFNSLFICVENDFGAKSQHYYSSPFRINSKSEALDTYKFIAGLKEEKLQSENKPPKSRKFNEQLDKPNMNMLEKNDQTEKGFTCKECLKEFSTASRLQTHVLHIHEPKNFKCLKCPRSYSTKYLLTAHLARSHIDLICAECGRSFNNINTLRTHEKTHYMKYVCQDCGRIYRNQSTFKKHFDNNICQMDKRHSPADAKFECDYCGKKYTQKITLRVHIQYEHGHKKYIECKWCAKKFWCQSRLNAHVVKHTKEKNFVCPLCNGKFVSKESLLYHTRIHTGEKPYQCDYCDGRFLSASRRQAHIRSHHTNVTFECDICYNKFKTNYLLTRHRKIHESNEIQKEADSNMNKIQQAVSNSKVEIMEHDVALNSLKYNVQSDEQPMVFKENALHPNKRVVYNIVETDVNLYELQIKNVIKNYDQVKFEASDTYMVNQEHNPISESQIYFVENEGDNYYEIKVSENIEI